MYKKDENEARSIRKSQHNFNEWAEKIIGDEFGFVIGFRLLPSSFPRLSILRYGPAEDTYHARTVTRYLLGKEGKKDRAVEIILAECDSLIQAHESIIDFIMSCMANRLPSGREKDIQVGDVTFGWYGEIPASVIFSRNNIMAIVRSVGEKDVEVKTVAQRLDKLLVSKHEKSTSKYAPNIGKFALSTQQAKIESKVNLEFFATDPKKKNLTYKIFSKAGQISRVGDTIAIKCSRKGTHDVHMTVINEDGLASVARSKLTVISS